MHIEAEYSHLTALNGGTSASSAGGVASSHEDKSTAVETTDVVSLSPEAMEFLREGAGWSGPPEVAPAVQEVQSQEAEASYADPSTIFGTEDGQKDPASDAEQTAPVGLSAKERIRLGQLRMQDAAVRSQQFSRIAVAGSLAGTQSTQFTSGPDGRLYATSGEVNVNTDPGHTPEESLVRASTLRRVSSTASSVIASNVVQENVAVHAAQIEIEARTEISAEVLNEIVRAVEFDAEVQRRDLGAAAEAANWTAPSELSAQAHQSQDEVSVGSTETELDGAAAVTEPEQSERSSDDPKRRSDFLELLMGRKPSSSQDMTRLDIVA